VLNFSYHVLLGDQVLRGYRAADGASVQYDGRTMMILEGRS
jgi:hypothetical protein